MEEAEKKRYRKLYEEGKKQVEFDKFCELSLKAEKMTVKDIQKFYPLLVDPILKRRENDPVSMLKNLMKALERIWPGKSELPCHGPWHHAVVPGILLTALRNRGYAVSDDDIREGIYRGLMLPAAGCAMFGTCGGCAGSAIALSVLMGSNPFTPVPRSEVMRASALTHERDAEIVGPRCCKRAFYTAVEVFNEFIEKIGYKMSYKVKGVCDFSAKNVECLKEDCPYYNHN